MLPRIFPLALFLGLLLPAVPAWPLNVVIKNQNTAYADSQVYFTFKDAPVTGTINGQTLVRDQAYSLADIGAGIALTQFSGGRVYFSLGAPLTGTGDPEPINSSVANWGTRFDKFEMTYSQTDHSGVANLTSIDFFAIPLALKTYVGNTATGTPLATLTYQLPGHTIATHLAALAGNDPRTLLDDSRGNFLRVLGPTLAPAGVYPSFQPYIAAVQAAGQSTHITGLYSHLPTSTATTTQNYDFIATYDTSGNLRLAGGGTSYAGGATVGPGHAIVIQAGDLALGVYSANPPYTVDAASAHIGDNDVYSAVVRDILTGYALGFVNSTTVDPNTGTAFKDEVSNSWWSSPRAFDFLQSNPAYYDQYAAYLQTISSAYGHPFSDRWQTVQASVDPASVGTLEIDVLPDVSTQAAPVVSSAASVTAQAGVAFSYQITASGSPASFGAIGMPAGLSVNTATGLITGMPAAEGVANVTLSATNGGGTGTLALTLTVDNRFDAWRTANFTAAEAQVPAISGPLGDATGAGIANLVKYALGIPPKRPGNVGLPTMSTQTINGSSYLVLTYTCDPLAADAASAVQVSGDLQSWNSGTAYTTEVNRTSNADGTQTVVTRGNMPVGSSTRQFMRLSVSLP